MLYAGRGREGVPPRRRARQPPLDEQCAQMHARSPVRPMLGIWLDAFGRAGVDEVLINLHYLPDVVTEYLAGRTGPPVVRTVLEPELLGSAGTLLSNRAWVEDEDFFLACNADNLTDFDLGQLVDAHWERRPVATLTLFRRRARRPVASSRWTPGTGRRLH